MGMRMMSAQSGDQIRMAVKDTLVSEEYKKEIEKIMTDPQFAGDFAKAINSEQQCICSSSRTRRIKSDSRYVKIS